MNNVQLVEHAQVATMLDCVLNIFSPEAHEIIVDVLSDQQNEALMLALEVIDNVSNSLRKKIETEGNA
jgi:hypothetical protein